MLEVAKERGIKFDAVQMPLNVMDAHYRSFEQLALPELVKQDIGVLGMKSMANGLILKSGVVSALECLQYALRLPVSVLITGIDTMEILDQAFTAVNTYQSLTEADIKALLARTARPPRAANSSCSRRRPCSTAPRRIPRGSATSPSASRRWWASSAPRIR